MIIIYCGHNCDALNAMNQTIRQLCLTIRRWREAISIYVTCARVGRTILLIARDFGENVSKLRSALDCLSPRLYIYNVTS